jgi:bacillithiol biosynthesis deacetylase BshB1
MADLLAIGAHPDDVEIWAGGLVARSVRAGYPVVILDLTRGELGTRGDVETRAREAQCAAEVLGVGRRENLGLADGDVRPTLEAKRRLAGVIRRHKPRVVLAPYWDDRHPDHEGAGRLVREAAFLAGLVRFEADGEGGAEPHRPGAVLYYMSWHSFAPTFIVDITDVYEHKLEAVRCYASQIDGGGAAGPQTRLSDAGFLDQWTGRQLHYGSLIGARYGEPYFSREPLPIFDPVTLWGRANAG